MSVEPASRSLKSLQHWFQAVITDPHGVESGISGEAASSALALQPNELERVILPSLRVSSLDRISIYANAYFARLTECLREEFPALLHALDEETFAAFAIGYLEAMPPHSYTLANLGARFAEFLATTIPHDEGTAEADWGLFLVELARLERLYSEVFDGPGDEGEPGLTIEKIKAVSPEQWENMKFFPLNSLRLIELAYPVHEYASAVRKGLEPELPERQTTWLLVWRHQFIVRRKAISRREYLMLRVLCQDGTLRDALSVVSRSSDDADLSEHELFVWFSEWTSTGLFRDIRHSMP